MTIKKKNKILIARRAKKTGKELAEVKRSP